MSAAKQHVNIPSTNVTTQQATCLQMTAKRPNKTTVCVLTLKKIARTRYQPNQHAVTNF